MNKKEKKIVAIISFFAVTFGIVPAANAMQIGRAHV